MIKEQSEPTGMSLMKLQIQFELENHLYNHFIRYLHGVRKPE